MPTLSAADASDLFRRPPERFLDVGAGEAAYYRVGTGPDVLFVHGWPVSGATFRCVLPYLADHVTCHVIDFPSAGASRFDTSMPLSIEGHIATVRKVIDLLGFESVAVVGHDSGGMIARHAIAGDDRVRGVGLINTEQPHGMSWRFKSFLSIRHLPGIAAGFGWVAGQRRLRRIGMVLGDAFADSSLLDGEFDEFFLKPLHDIPARRTAAIKVLRTFDARYVTELADVHRRIAAPVQMVWGDQDPFFPLPWAEEMVGTFADARLHVVKGAGLFSHEERPAEVAEALLPTLLGRR